MNATIILHPAMSGLEANEWCRRYRRFLTVRQRQGKVHLLVIAEIEPTENFQCKPIPASSSPAPSSC